MAPKALYDLRTKGESIEKGISRFICQRADVDICTRLLLERERLLEKEHMYARARADTEKKLVEALKEIDKYREYFQSLLSIVKSILEPHSIVLNIFNSQLTRISEIKARYFAETPKVISIWLFIEEDNWIVEENIYEAYGQLLDFFPDTEIDLRLMKLFDRKPEELLPEGFKPW